MGKTKNKTRRGKKPGPTGLKSVKETLLECEDLLNEDHPKTMKDMLESIIEKLQSNGIEDKDCACGSLAMLCNKTEAIPEIIQSNVVKIVAPCLIDSSLTVSHSTVGALRTISACTDHEVCEAMVDQDVLTPLVALFKRKYLPSEWKPHPPVKDKIDSKKEIYVEAVQLLWNLCGSSSRAVRIFCKENLLSHLMPCLNIEVYGHDVAVAVAYCLYTVCEDNAEIAAILSETSNTEIIYSLLNITGTDSQCTLLRVLAAGIILNQNCNKLTGCPPLVVSTFMRVLAEALGVNVVPLLGVTLQKIRENEEALPFEEGSIEKLISAQQVALEIIINLLCVEDDADSWDNASSSDNSDDINPLAVSSMECDDTQTELPCSVPTEVHEALLSHDFLAKVLAKVQFLDQELVVFMRKCEVGKRIYKNLITLQSRSFFCLNNLVTCLDVEELGGAEEMYRMWISLGQFVFQQSSESRLELLESATSAMSAILSKLAEKKSELYEQFSPEDLQKLLEMVKRTPDAHIKVNVIRIVGGLGSLLATSKSVNATTMVKTIGSFLLEVGNNKDNELWVESEALDALLDVFSEDETHPLSLEIGLVDKLRYILSSFKHKINFQRKSLGDHLPVAMTVKTNLARFIRYKTNFSPSNGHSN